MSIWAILVEDWRKIPQNFRYSILFGVSLLVIVWFTDHWDSSQLYSLLGLDFRNLFFSIGVISIVLGLALLAWKQVSITYRIARLRKKYSLSNLGVTFYLLWFNQQLILFDKKEKRSFHIHPLETARDLWLNTHGFALHKDFDTANANNEVIDVPAAKLKIRLSNYKYSGQINTRQ